MYEQFKNFMGVVGLLILGTLYSSLSWGLLCWKFWYWFLLPVFTTLPNIMYLEAVGLMMFISLFKNHNAQPVIKDELAKIKNNVAMVTNFVIPWLMLFMGWFVHIFVVK